jgi:hypothetical protein
VSQPYGTPSRRDMSRIIRLPLPRRVRLRLLVQHQIDSIGIWLCDHHGWRLAAIIWRVRT